MNRTSRHLKNGLRALLVAAVAATTLPISAAYSKPTADVAAQQATDTPRRFEKPAHTKDEPGRSRDLVHVKLVEGSGLRLRGGRLVTPDGRRVPELSAVLESFRGARVSRLFSAPESELDTMRRAQQKSSGRSLADLNLYFAVHVRGGEAAALTDALNALDIVEIAYPAPLPVAPATADFTRYQGYASPSSSGGVNSKYANTLPGGRGENVRIVDVEYSWNRNHEDLPALRASGSRIDNGTPCDPFVGELGSHSTDHGTAVIGEIAGSPNAIGVTGLAPRAHISTTNASRVGSDAYGRSYCGYDLANAIITAARSMRRGDVMLIEQQVDGPRWRKGSDVGLLPVEWIPAYYDAIVSATAKGIIVVEAAGNGYQNLDDPMYRSMSVSNRPDSGAIMVGAGGAPGCTAPARGRLSFSNHGSRVDVQGWGECVTTTGYDDLQGGGINQWYTASFSGTSSASPIVASAAAILSSIAEHRGVSLSPRAVRRILKTTGVAQQAGLAGRIGPLPNLKAAIAEIPGSAGTANAAPSVSAPTHTLLAGVALGTNIPVSISWRSSDSNGIAATTLSMRVDGGAWQNLSLARATSTSKSLRIAPGSTYQFAVRAKDTKGSWSAWKYGPRFRGDAYQENEYVGYAPEANWARAGYSAASGGYLDVASARGSTASFSFTGRSVAWVGTLAANRGVASIYVDGTFWKSVDMYSASTLPQQLVVSLSWATSARHTVQVVAEATSGRPKIDVDAFVRLT